MPINNNPMIRMTSRIPIGPQIGSSTNHQDHVITLVNFKMMNTSPNNCKKLGPTNFNLVFSIIVFVF